MVSKNLNKKYINANVSGIVANDFSTFNPSKDILFIKETLEVLFLEDNLLL